MKKFEMTPFLWGAVVAAVVLPLVSFSAGWIVTSGYADEKAQQRADKAVLAALTEICVAQVPNGSARSPALVGLKDANYSDRGEFVAAQGWATMPGTETPNSAVARECAVRLLATL